MSVLRPAIISFRECNVTFFVSAKKKPLFFPFVISKQRLPAANEVCVTSHSADTPIVFKLIIEIFFSLILTRSCQAAHELTF